MEVLKEPKRQITIDVNLFMLTFALVITALSVHRIYKAKTVLDEVAENCYCFQPIHKDGQLVRLDAAPSR